MNVCVSPRRIAAGVMLAGVLAAGVIADAAIPPDLSATSAVNVGYTMSRGDRLTSAPLEHLEHRRSEIAARLPESRILRPQPRRSQASRARLRE